MKYYGYTEFKEDTLELIKQTKEQKFDAIVGIARGGLILSHALSEALDIRNVQTLRTELYDSSIKRDNFLLHDYSALEGVDSVVVVDDIADSGETLQKVMQHLQEKYPQVKFYSLTLFYKKSSVYEPDFWLKEANDWIEFFWEKDFISKS